MGFNQLLPQLRFLERAGLNRISHGLRIKRHEGLIRKRVYRQWSVGRWLATEASPRVLATLSGRAREGEKAIIAGAMTSSIVHHAITLEITRSGVAKPERIGPIYPSFDGWYFAVLHDPLTVAAIEFEIGVAKGSFILFHEFGAAPWDDDENAGVRIPFAPERGRALIPRDPADPGSRFEPLVQSAREMEYHDLLAGIGTDGGKNGSPLADDTSRDGLLRANDFDADHYLSERSDVAEAGLSAEKHFLSHGWKEGAAPRADLDTFELLRRNRDFRRHVVEHDADWSAHVDKAVLDSGVPTHPPAISAAYALAAPRAVEGILCAGYVEAGLGLGESLRSFVSALADERDRVRLLPINAGVETRYIGRFSEELYDLSSAYPVNIVQVAVDQLSPVLLSMGRWRLSDSYNILRTYWELSSAPEEWRASLTQFDELWAPTHFIARSLAGVFDGPITIVPTVVDVTAVTPMPKRDLGFQDDCFVFGFSFDRFSTLARKNPLAVASAFSAAFPDDSGVGLVLKTTGPLGSNTEEDEGLAALTKKDMRVRLLEEQFPRGAMLGFLEAIDCYVSLHRSEGFGLGMAEAMALGTPVIGTNYGGCTDFLCEATGFPVRYEERALRDHEYPYASDRTWAEPDIEHAAALMRRVVRGRDDVRKRAAAAKVHIREWNAPEVVARRAARRLAEIGPEGRQTF